MGDAQLVVLAVALLLLLALVWIFLPLAIVGIKPLLRQLIREQQQTNALLAELLDAQRPKP